ncbi:MAG: M23 family metallopeptidase, partial [Terriglobales bacterium]
PGDRVRQGQVVGCIGFTGDSIFPHLHYSFMDGGEAFKAWGLPAYFSHFRRVLEASWTKVERGRRIPGISWRATLCISMQSR